MTGGLQRRQTDRHRHKQTDRLDISSTFRMQSHLCHIADCAPEVRGFCLGLRKNLFEYESRNADKKPTDLKQLKEGIFLQHGPHGATAHSRSRQHPHMRRTERTVCLVHLRSALPVVGQTNARALHGARRYDRPCCSSLSPRPVPKLLQGTTLFAAALRAIGLRASANFASVYGCHGCLHVDYHDPRPRTLESGLARQPQLLHKHR